MATDVFVQKSHDQNKLSEGETKAQDIMKWQMHQCFFVKCQVLDREEKNQNIKDVEDGNSRNGYHKVKCQVPETEELQGREEERKITNQQ